MQDSLVIGIPVGSSNLVTNFFISFDWKLHYTMYGYFCFTYTWTKGEYCGRKPPLGNRNKSDIFNIDEEISSKGTFFQDMSSASLLQKQLVNCGYHNI